MVHRQEWGRMAALRGNKIISIPLLEAISTNRKVDKEILDAAIGILDKLDYKVSKTSEETSKEGRFALETYAGPLSRTRRATVSLP